MSILFSRKIKCFHCGKKYKAKIERGKRKYICSNYDNYGKCVRIPIDQEFLKGLIIRRFNRDMTDQEIKDAVEEIVIEDKLLFKIFIKNQNPIEFGRNFLKF